MLSSALLSMGVDPYLHDRIIVNIVAESMIENEGRGNGMIPATEISIKALKMETILEGESCTICLEELSGGSEVTVMPCSHIFHGSCIIRWLKQSHVCPICRFEMPTCSQ
ncbi:hypothetical protein VitviT2T_000906 [Vitis vinifera]|uniref:RING-type E3 ubiquitin transferase n=1 Tax=Vitis vinifera TaxID=29760 RepID=A0ABY9BDX4_VITVI|nr:hypothetical protein VitviT2T_000906 [Vitis vinifera]